MRFIKPGQALELIKKAKNGAPGLFGRKPELLFRDDNIFSDPGYAKKLFKEMAPLGIKWSANSSIDIAFDDQALAKASGCRELFIGFETIYPEKLQKTSAGNMHSTDGYIKAIRKVKSYGIKVIGAFILGFDYYTHKDYFRLIYFLARARLYLISLTILTPFPGSALYEQLLKENRITSFDWRKYDSLQHVVFKPKHMPAWALQAWFVVIRSITLLLSPLYIELVIKSLALLFFSYYVMFYLSGLLIRLFF